MMAFLTATTQFLLAISESTRSFWLTNPHVSCGCSIVDGF